ncbi:hypothetical protein [Leuconostoc mesenteroides]|uniref:hypothetical protein n=1 Tax=Leuconostoc mesenteroides TaxID=1245 RepID=UPI00119E7F9A|nr:hypothetical protein [Leuconostoc mesenteroides]
MRDEELGKWEEIVDKMYLGEGDVDRKRGKKDMFVEEDRLLDKDLRGIGDMGEEIGGIKEKW